MADRSGQQLGNYRLNRLLGKGGFGAVYHATHVLLDRDQAIKVLLEDHLSDPKAFDRFLREAKTLAKLDHPNIVHVDELGMDGSVVYLVMPFLSGGTLQEMLKQRASPLSLEETGRILEQVCAALDFAHGQGVVHLDLKPLNLLRHQDGRWLLSDFGLAHLMQTGALIGGTSLSFGTPYYMAPEHILGNPERRSDLYALGCMLYQLLTGHLPFEAAVAQAIMFKHISDPPPKLSGYRTDLPAALEGVSAKALAKKPEERYQTAAEVLAAFKDALGKHRVQPANLLPVTANQNPPAAEQHHKPGTLLLTLRGHEGEVYAVEWAPDGQRLASVGNDKTLRIWDAATGQLLRTLKGHADSVISVAWSSNGQQIATASHDKTLRVWNAATGQSIHTLEGHTGILTSIVWSPDGQWLASGSWDHNVYIWNASTGTLLNTLAYHLGWIHEVAWSPDGRFLASTSRDLSIQIWNAATGEPLKGLTGYTSPEFSVKWASDGRLASAGRDRVVHIWDTASGQLLAAYTGHSDVIFGVAWSPNSQRLASAGSDKTVRLWDTTNGQEMACYTETDVAYSVSWSPDGHQLASASRDGTIKVWWVS